MKGAPQTFDAAAFVAALRRVREEPAATVLWPDFDRVVEATVPDAGGRPEQYAVRHVDESDLPNAELVARSRRLADRVILP
jgi:hypothetical protein